MECLVKFSDLNIQKVQILDKIESDESYTNFIIYIKYWDNKEGKDYLNNSLINLDRQGDKTNYSHMNYPLFHNYSYDFKSQVFFGTHNRYFFRDFNFSENKIEIPIIRKFSDGGILWVEEFVNEANDSKMISDDIIYLRFDHDFILYDIKNNKVIKWYDFGYDLIQSIDIVDKGIFSVSAGLNSYFINIEDN